MRQYVVLQCAFQVETMLADVALESSHARVRQLVCLQHRRSLEPRRAEIARERRVRGMDDHVGLEAAGPQEALAAGRAPVRPRVSVRQFMTVQRLLVETLFPADGTVESSSFGVYLGLVLPQRAFPLIKPLDLIIVFRLGRQIPLKKHHKKHRTVKFCSFIYFSTRKYHCSRLINGFILYL